MAQKTIAQQAVAIFMSGSLAEAKQILEIGIAIVEQRAAAPIMTPVAPVRRKPGPKGLPPVPPAQAGNIIPPDPAVPVRRRPGRPAGTGKASGPVGVVPPAASAPDASTAPVTRRRGRPPVTPAAAVETPEAAPTAQATPLVGFTELPPQGDPGEDDA